MICGMKILAKIWPKKRIFLDYASITPVDPEVQKVMAVAGNSANPSALYEEAILAKAKMKAARSSIARFLNAQEKEIFFTSGGTEGNNLAILGIFEAAKKQGIKPHLITSKIEHPSVLEVFSEVEKRGGEVTYLDVSEDGFVLPKTVREALKPNTVLISIMLANNEIGTVEPIKEISKVIKDFKNNKVNKNYPYFHSDACQAALYLKLDVLKMGLDLLTLDGIKVYGPRGSGALYVRDETLIEPIIFGGGQEKGLRSGTENMPAILGLAKSLEIAEDLRDSESWRLSDIRDYAIDKILKNFPKASLNGSKKDRLPNNINICFPGLDAEFVVISLDVAGISASYSSSCRTLKEDSSSYVIESIGKNDCKNSSLRFTLGRESKKSDIDKLVSVLKKILK